MRLLIKEIHFKREKTYGVIKKRLPRLRFTLNYWPKAMLLCFFLCQKEGSPCIPGTHFTHKQVHFHTYLHKSGNLCTYTCIFHLEILNQELHKRKPRASQADFHTFLKYCVQYSHISLHNCTISCITTHNTKEFTKETENAAMIHKFSSNVLKYCSNPLIWTQIY